MNKKSRSSVKMNDKKYRPEIMKKEMDMSSYDEIHHRSKPVRSRNKTRNQ